jgi:hypothetical protein
VLCVTARAGEEGKKAPSGPAWEKIFHRDRILSIHLTVEAKDWEGLPRRPFEYVRARFECGETTIAAVGLRVKGNSSSSVPNVRKSLKLDFDRFEKDRTFHGVNKLNLHNGFKDPTLMREHLAYRLFREAGVPASRTAYARVHITIPGVRKRSYLGLYTAVEQVNGPFLRDRFKDAGGNLWKGEGGSDFTDRGKDPSDYGPYQLKRNEERGDYSGLIAFVRMIHDTPDRDFAATVEKHLDVKAFLAYTAVNTLLANLDSPTGTGHNYYVYREPASGRFTLIPWDLNEAFGNFRMGSGRDMERLSIREPYSGDKILFRKVLAVKRFREDYLALLKTLAAGPFSPASMAREIDRVDRLIRKAVEEDPFMAYSNEEYRKALEEDIPARGPWGRGGGVLGLKSFVRKRVASVKAQLRGKSKGTKPQGRTFRGPPAGGGAVRAAKAEGRDSLFLLTTGGVLLRLSRDGKRTLAEARLPFGGSGGAADGHVEEFLREFDRNRDGRVSESEFRGPREVFKRADRNGDRVLDREEIGKLGPKGGRGGAGEREFTIHVGKTTVAVVGADTVYAFAVEGLKTRGHNRFGAPEGTHFEKRDRGRGPAGAVPITGKGDTLWLLSEGRLLRMDLKKLVVRAETELPAVEGSRDVKAWFHSIDTNDDGVIDLFEWRQARQPPEVFQHADRNRDRRLDAKELRNVPPPSGAGRNLEGATLTLEGKEVHVKAGGKTYRFHWKSLERLED